MATLCLNEVIAIDPGSIAEELGIPVGSRLIEINGREIQDRLDYWFLSAADELVLVMDEGDEIVEYEIEKAYDENLGLVFPDSLMAAAKHCHNHCVFCFIDQLPKGLRNSLYFKDDDSRLSFLQGNFITLTNLKRADLERIVEYGIHPINVSIHSMNPDIRHQMLGNPKSRDIESQLQFLAEHRVGMNAQIVLVPGYNDGDDLLASLTKLREYHPHMRSIGIVPVGLTKFRDHLPEIRAFTPFEAADVIERVHAFQKESLQELGTRLAFLADEFYLLAERAIPDAASYEDFVQFENGIGMIRRFQAEFAAAKKPKRLLGQRHFVTGTAFYPQLQTMVDQINMQYNKQWKVSAIQNHFLGESITVAGLITGADLVAQLKVQPDECVVLCESMFNSDGLTLDDYTQRDLAEALACDIAVVPGEGQILWKESLCPNQW